MENWIEKIKNYQPGIYGQKEALITAVVVPLVESRGKTCILFEKRSPTLEHQPGEICFPGGATEPGDRNPQVTAIRETCEELGLSPDDIELIGQLDTLAPPNGLILYPFVARLKDINRIQINQAEVEKVFWIPLEYLLQYQPKEYKTILQAKRAKDFPYHLIPQGINYPFRVNQVIDYFYIWEGIVIWGLTARILHHLLELIK